jgi:protoheme IX farnesyltransferase
MLASLRLIGSVFKLRIAVAITLSALVGVAVTPGADLAVWQLAVLAFAVCLSAASAGAFNQYVEREPLWLGLIAGLLVIAVGAAALALNVWAALHVFLGAFVYGVVYTVWLKNRTWLNIVLGGGLAGSFAVLAGASAVDPGLAPAPVILAVVLFLWTPPHFWSLATALHEDYARAGVPMLPVVVGDALAAKVILGHTVALVLISLLPAAFGLGWIYLAGAVAGGGYFIVKSLDLVRTPDRKSAMANFHASLLQLGLLQIAAIADRFLLG